MCYNFITKKHEVMKHKQIEEYFKFEVLMTTSIRTGNFKELEKHEMFQDSIFPDSIKAGHYKSISNTDSYLMTKSHELIKYDSMRQCLHFLSSGIKNMEDIQKKV